MLRCVNHSSRDSPDMSENDLDNLLESIDLEDAINELEFSSGEDIKQLEKEDAKPEPADIAVAAQKPDTVKQQSKWRGVTCVLMLTVLVAIIGSCTQFGYNTGVINNPKGAITESFNSNASRLHVHFTNAEVYIAVAIYAIGGMTGALTGGFIADHIGRKYTMLLNNLVISLAVILQSFAVHPAMFIIGRFVCGINSGTNTAVLPLYMTEIPPVHLRGSVGVSHQLGITGAILLSQILGLNYALGRPDSQFYGWRILFAVPLLFALFQGLTLPWCPESPRFLYIKRKNKEATIRALVRLRGTADIEEELQAMKDELAEIEKPKVKVSLWQFITRPSLRFAMTLSIILHLSQQLTGMIGVLFYSTEIFAAAGIQYSEVATVIVGVTLFGFTVVTLFLVEVLGRRTLMLYGLGGMAVCFTLLTSMFCFKEGFYSNPETAPTVTAPGILLVISSLGVTIFYALGPGAIPWTMVPELFLQETRSVAVTVATIVNWLATFVVGFVFPYILFYLYPYGTSIFIVLCAVIWLYLYLYLPETKGRSVESITMELRDRAGEVKEDLRKSTVETTKTDIDAVELQDMTPRTERAFKGQTPILDQKAETGPNERELEVEVDIGVEIRLRADSGDERELMKEAVTSL